MKNKKELKHNLYQAVHNRIYELRPEVKDYILNVAPYEETESFSSGKDLLNSILKEMGRPLL